VIDPTGQRINASDRLYLTSKMPSLIVWGGRDRIIPAKHGQLALEAMPGSTLELFDDAGHFPHLDDPLRFVRTLEAFFEENDAAQLDTRAMREVVLDRDPKSSAILKRLQREHPAV
jgi:alpha-beta hydrolase superfamily lysophospholipase